EQVVGRAVTAESLGHRVEPRGREIDDRAEQVVLGSEVAVDQPGAHPGVAGDLLDPGGGEAAPREERHRCRQDPVAGGGAEGRVLLLAAGHCSADLHWMSEFSFIVRGAGLAGQRWSKSPAPDPAPDPAPGTG